MLREFYLLTILAVFLVHPITGSINPRGKCYTFNNGTKPAPENCCDRTKLENPCNTFDCREDQTCELVYTSETENCTHDYLPFKPQCRVICKPVTSCAKGCTLIKDNNQCNFCYCDSNFTNPCVAENPCNKSEVCTLQQVECFAPPCYPIAECNPIFHCPMIQRCPTNCLNYKNYGGCPGCYCCNKCVNTQCPTGQKCVLEPVTCVRCPCHPVAECV